MNVIFQKLLKDNATAFKPFLQWYAGAYGMNAEAMFQNLPFSHQIGVYLEYFEKIYSLTVIVSIKGYTVHFTDNRKVPLKSSENNFEYNHYRFNHKEPKTIMYGYELAIVWLFENYNLPF